MTFGAGDVILFGIQAGLRLFGQARQSYIERTRERKLSLPLPGLADHSPTGTQARLYFSSTAPGRQRLVTSPRIRVLHEAALAGLTTFKQQDKEGHDEYVQFFAFCRAEDMGLRASDGLLASDIVALNSISQWRSGDEPHPSALRRIAGTLTEIGIDYFAHGPGTIRGNTPRHDLLRELLNALDDHSFSSEGLEGVLEKLFVASLDSIAESPALVTGDPRRSALVVAVARGLATDINTRLVGMDDNERLFGADRLGDTAQLVFRSVLRHAGQTVLESPSQFLDVEGPGETALISRVGTELLEALVPADGGGGLDGLLSSDTLDGVVKAALGVVAEHPELVRVEGEGLRKILQGVAGAVAAGPEKVGPDLLPEVARLILERTGEHLSLLWKVDGGEHLLVTATSTLLSRLAAPAADGMPWRFRLGRSQVLDAVEAVLDEVADNPALLGSTFGHDSALGAVVEVVTTELASVELEDLSSDTVRQLLVLAAQAAAARIEFLDDADLDGSVKTALGHALAALLGAGRAGSAAAQSSAWTLARASVLEALSAVALDKLAEVGPDAQALAALGQSLAAVTAKLNSGGAFSIELFSEELEAALAA